MSFFSRLLPLRGAGKPVAVVVVVLAALAGGVDCAGVLGIDDPDVVADGGRMGSDAGARSTDATMDAVADAAQDAVADAAQDVVADAAQDAVPDAVQDAFVDAADGGPPSCELPGPGRTDCGPAGDASCCTSIAVSGGTFYRDYDDTTTYPDAGNPAYVTGFLLDKYEVTVGRFRQFVTAWDNGFRIDAGAGTHLKVNNGMGLQMPTDAGAVYEQGWETAWSGTLPTTLQSWGEQLTQCPDRSWSSGDDKEPINCVTWIAVYAFCIWDGGYLPSEAEWDYVAQGGPGAAGQRAYPWSSPSTSTLIDCAHANFAGGVDGGSCNDAGGQSEVGSVSPIGDDALGHSDLAGNVWEWTRDSCSPGYVKPCYDCANVADSTSHCLRGGSYHDQALSARAAHRYEPQADQPEGNIGVRCARPLP